MKNTLDIISDIWKIKRSGTFENYIEYIVFPFYKNLKKRTRVNFKFPLTVLVGKNGSGKSSTLHALFGAPKGYSLGDFWFSTEVDPIAESGEANRFYYGYRISKSDNEIREVMKTRSKRSEGENKKEDPDYWETCRPRKGDGMLVNYDSDNKIIREPPVTKDVIYIDFRSEISAFDKVLHFSKEDLEKRKNLLRERSKYVNRLFKEEPMRFPGTDDKNIGIVSKLDSRIVEIISSILGKKYIEIKIAEHKVYKNPGVSAFIKTEIQGQYSEANAGSGEFAVIQLVRQIENAKNYSLVLLDEPEVSIHPGAQQRLKEYLLRAIRQKKIQVIISTHSPTLIEGMPPEAIKLYRTTESGKFEVTEDVSYQEAFYDIEDRPENKKIIYCEDYTAQMIIQKVLNSMNKNDLFEVLYLPGGEKTLVKHYMPPFALNKTLSDKVFLFLDGDMKSGYKFVGEENLTKSQASDATFLADEVQKAFGTKIDAFSDGGETGSRNDQKCAIYLQYLNYYNSNVFFIGDKNIPEEILLMSQYVKKHYGETISKYSTIDGKNAKDVVAEISSFDHGDADHIQDTISILANKWSQETCEIKKRLVDDIDLILTR